MNTLVTIGCVSFLIALGIIIVCMFRAMQRDAREMDAERERELRDFKDNQ